MSPVSLELPTAGAPIYDLEDDLDSVAVYDTWSRAVSLRRMCNISGGPSMVVSVRKLVQSDNTSKGFWHRMTMIGSVCTSRQTIRLIKRWASQLPERNAAFCKLDSKHIEAFAGLLSTPESSLLTTISPQASTSKVRPVGSDELTPFNEDWQLKYRGRSQLVLKPKSTKEVSAIVKYCFENRIAIVPQGGNTGLVGGSVPVYDEVVLSLSAMNQIRSFDPVSGIVSTDAGVILQKLDDYLAAEGFIAPLDLGAKGSCHIGGNVATNAGGLRLLRYGSLHGSVLGLEVVLPDKDGSVLQVGMNGLRKDNTGYDLKQLFIGSEGTLGIITGISLLAPRRSQSTSVAFLAVPSYEAVQEVFKVTKSKLGEILSAFEFLDTEGLGCVLRHKEQPNPMDGLEEHDKPFYVLIETSGSNKDHDDEKLSDLLEGLLGGPHVINGVLADNETQLQSLWSLREGVAEAAAKWGKVYKYDLSVPVGQMYGIAEECRELFKKHKMDKAGDGTVKAVIGYGHLGDGNIHINVVADSYSKRIEDVLEPWIYERVAARNGSISAEHGLGLMKAPYIGYSQQAQTVNMMRKIKELFDPRGLMNPYKYFLPEQAAPSSAAYQTSEPGH